MTALRRQLQALQTRALNATLATGQVQTLQSRRARTRRMNAHLRAFACVLTNLHLLADTDLHERIVSGCVVATTPSPSCQ